VTEQLDKRADTTRLQILRAASRQFARKSYNLVSLDDILSDADVTKGAMYFHFRSKHALASAIIDYRADKARAAVAQLLARKLSGLETMIDVSFQIAVDDIGDESARAGLNLLESIGRTDGLRTSVLARWVRVFADFSRKAVEEGDVDGDPAAIAKLVVSMYLGLRQTSNLEEPEAFLRDLENAWGLVLSGFAKPERVGYVTQFVKRRTAIAIRKARPL
jgi:AcrR family transcriptional regulator